MEGFIYTAFCHIVGYIDIYVKSDLNIVGIIDHPRTVAGVQEIVRQPYNHYGKQNEIVRQ